MRRHKWLLGIAMTAALALTSSMTVDAALKEEEKWLITYHEPQTREVLSSYAKSYEIHAKGQFVTVAKSELSNQEIRALRESAEVAYIEPVRIRQAFGLEQSKELWDYQLLNIDTMAKPVTGAEKVLVAVIDTGIEAAHPYLSDVVVEGYDTINDVMTTIDEEGHGTHVAGIVKRATEGFPIEILPVRVLDESGYGESVDIAEGIIYAADQGADVINMSLGGPEITKVEQEAIAYAQQKGVFVVVAAGNDASDVHMTFPANVPSVLTIGAVGKVEDEIALASFSNTGTLIDLVAPGEGILSTYPESFDVEDELQDGYTELDGTSMATPFVSGVAAIVKSVYPTLLNDEIEILLKKHATDLFEVGFDTSVGFGHASLASFNKNVLALQLRTTEANEETMQLEIGTNGYASGTLQVIIGETTYEAPFNGNGYHAVPVTISDSFAGAEVTVKLLQQGKVVKQMSQRLYVAPVEMPIDIVNEKGRYPKELLVNIYGLVNGELEYITSNYWYDVTEEATIFLPDASKYEKLWAVIVADKAVYTVDITEDEAIIATNDTLVPTTFKNSYTLIREHTKTYDSSTYFELYPKIEGMLSDVYISFTTENSRETYYVQPGFYDLVAYDYNSPELMAEAKDIEVKEKYTFDVIDYTDVVDVTIDWSQLVFDEQYHIFKVTSAANEQMGRYGEIGELKGLVLSPGTYTFGFYYFDEELFEEVAVYEETIEVTADQQMSFSGVLSSETADVKTTVEAEDYQFIPYPGLPLGEWKPFTLNRSVLFPRKPWIVTFSQPVNADTIEGNIYIVDERGVPIDVNFTFSDSFKSLQIIPQQQYRKGTYHLYIDGKVEALTGEPLGKGIKGTFTY